MHSSGSTCKNKFLTMKYSFGRKTILALLFLLSFTQYAAAQVARLYTTKHGLKTNNCRKVDIDTRGFVWLSGFNMLGIFDGTRFQFLPNQSEGGHSLFQIAYGVKEAEDDHYWVATSQGLYMLNARKMEFQRIFLQEDEDSIYGFAINSIIDYPKQDYKLITTDGFSMFLVNQKTLKVDRVLSNKLNEAALDYFVSHPLIDKHQRLWATVKNQTLICIDLQDNLKQRTIRYSPAATAIVQSGTMTHLLEMPEGILIGTNHGLLMYDEKLDCVVVLNTSPQNLYISTIIQTKDGRILVGTDGRGIWEYSHNSGGHSLTPFYGDLPDFDLSYGKVMDMKEDYDGNIIAVLLNKGLVVFPPQNNCFHYHAISPQGNKRNANCITSMEIDQQKNYWIATDGCGVFKTNGMKLATAYPVTSGLHSLLVQDIKIDKHGTPWAASYGGGVQYYENGMWKADWVSRLSHEPCMTMYYNPSTDRLLLGTNGNGIFCIDIANHSVQSVEIPFNYNPWISCLLEDTDQTLWVGTSSGLFHYNPLSGKHGELKLDGRRIDNASAIKQDGEHILIASEDGLIIYNRKTQKLGTISQQEGLSCPQVRAITTTNDKIWLGTRTNIASIDKQNYAVKNYSSFNGYEVGEIHRNSSLIPSDEYILYGGDNGIICFSPELIDKRPINMKHVYFTGFSTPLHTEKLDASIFYAQSIELEADNNSFNILFSSTEKGDPERIHYDYILEGHERQWHTDTSAPSASYSSLPAGHYTFRVKAYFEDNPSQSTETSISITVATAWYATPWAYLVYLLIACVVIYIIWGQLQQRKRQREELRQTAERDRIKEAKLHMFTSIAHELRSPLTMIESPLQQLKEEDPTPEHQSLYEIMQRNCDRLLDIVKQITDIRKIDAGQFTLHLELQDYVPYANKVFEQFKGIATTKQIDFTVEHNEEELLLMIDTTHFEKIITNLLSNAFKFTPTGGKVTVRSSIKNGAAELQFYNSGSHLSDEDISHLWERFYQGSAGTDATGSGIGLNLVNELVKLHHGSITVKNLQPDGVEFTLRFPCSSKTQSVETGGHTTLLLVDDDTEIVNYLSSQLSRDYNIIKAFSGNSAWKLVLARRPDVVVTDYRMPDGTGLELCQLIKGNPETDNTPVIMLTGEGDDTVQLQSLTLQVDHYLEKPVNVPLLRSAILQALRVRENVRNKVNRKALSSEVPTPVIENADDKLFSKVSEAIKNSLDNSEFSVQQLSEEVGISRVHLNRKMKERYGMSPNAFIRSFRLKQAAYLLMHNKVNVSEVAYKVGFSSHSYFTTAFHEHFGMSPKEFFTYYSEKENQPALQKLLEELHNV